MLRQRNAISFLAALAMAAVLQVPAVAAEPSAEEVVVTVEGIACPFCAYGLEKHLEQLNGVSDVQVDVGKSQATLVLEKGSAPSDEDIREAVRRAGFTSGEVRRGGEKRVIPQERQRRTSGGPSSTWRACAASAAC